MSLKRKNVKFNKDVVRTKIVTTIEELMNIEGDIEIIVLGTEVTTSVESIRNPDYSTPIIIGVSKRMAAKGISVISDEDLALFD